MDLLQRFKQQLDQLGVDQKSKILLAVSGGLDSMVLLNLSRESGISISVSHVNYHLRGKASDLDQQLVEEYCAKHKIPFYSKSFRITEDDLRDGLQGAARKLRYGWFNELTVELKLDFIFTAHHINDRIETFFINLLRGAGLKGLKSIPSSNDLIKRPLLNFSREELKEYALSQNLVWREDESNASDKYLRNKIRHGIANDLADLSPDANTNLIKSIDLLGEANSYFTRLAKGRIAAYKSENDMLSISDQEWRALFDARPLHKYVFDELGFRPDQFDQLENLVNSQVGKKVIGNLNEVYRDRGKFLVSRIAEIADRVVQIEDEKGSIEFPLPLTWELIKNANDFDFKNPNLAYLDFEKISFPLTVRRWQDGDTFKPFGMKGSKKISDYLTDRRMPIPEKNRTMVLLSQGKIVWLIGHRLADGFGVDGQTKSILKFERSA